MPVKRTRLERLISLVKERKVQTFHDLCVQLDLSPQKAEALIERARTRGAAIDLAGDRVGIRPTEPSTDTQTVRISPVRGEYSFAVVSDPHFGSKYHLRAQLIDFAKRAIDQGAQCILGPGDNLDGCYRHGRWELTHHGFEDQAAEMIENWPRGVPSYIITGNHDQTFEAETGMVVHASLQDKAIRAGRRDLHFVGARGARLWLAPRRDARGALVDLWHPLKGPAYALTYGLQKKAEAYAPGDKPDFLLTGHWHSAVYAVLRGIHSFACGTFQGGGSSFSKSLVGPPTVGGWIVKFGLTDEGTVRYVQPEFVAYYQHEKPRRVVL